MYSAKYVCTEAMPAGTFTYGRRLRSSRKNGCVDPQPERFSDHFIPESGERFVRRFSARNSRSLDLIQLGADYSIKLTCDDVAKMLTGDPNADFSGTYGIGVTVEDSWSSG